MRRFGEPDEAAQTVLFLMSDEASYVVGANVNISGGR
ncbi:MAG: SDR family oxidoreductase [Xanthobacteraceae bacterium]